MTLIKICGVRTAADIEKVNTVQPDFIGFVFAKSRRWVNPELAARLRQKLAEPTKAVGVFVDANIEEIVALYDSGVIDLAQLHGNEDPTFIKTLRESCSVPIIKAVQLGATSDIGSKLHAAAAVIALADYLLLDTAAGSGKRFDWKQLREFSPMNKPWFLAGGLTPENLEEALSYKPDGVDVSSGVETGGSKCELKLGRFVSRVRESDSRNGVPT